MKSFVNQCNLNLLQELELAVYQIIHLPKYMWLLRDVQLYYSAKLMKTGRTDGLERRITCTTDHTDLSNLQASTVSIHLYHLHTEDQKKVTPLQDIVKAMVLCCSNSHI